MDDTLRTVLQGFRQQLCAGTAWGDEGSWRRLPGAYSLGPPSLESK